MKKIISLFIICLLILTACSSGGYETIDTNKALELIENGATIIDVRELNEYNREHITNAINIPLTDINSIDIDKDSVIIVYCQSGIRSMKAASSLVELGYKNIYNLDGGLLNWGGSLEE